MGWARPPGVLVKPAAFRGKDFAASAFGNHFYEFEPNDALRVNYGG
jgi:hypothetical protein